MKTAYATCLWLINLLWITPAAYAEESFILPERPAFSTECWTRVEYLGWTLRKSPIPLPLVTSASFSDSIPGAIGQPGTKVLLGNKTEGKRWQNGFQISAGTTLNTGQALSIEGSYFLLPRVTIERSLNTTGEPGAPNLAVPIYDVTGFWGLNGVPGETIYILPGPLLDEAGFEGRLSLKISSLFQGAALNCCAYLGCRDGFSLEGISGLRWLQLQEDLTFNVHTKTAPNVSFPPGFYNAKDRFRTANNFFGAQLGLHALYRRCNWFVEVTPKVSLGVLNQHVSTHGVGETSDGNLFYSIKGPAQLVGGIFAQPTNIGNHSRNICAAAFETSLRVGYQVTSCLEIFLGYNFISISRVARPGDQMNRKINPTRTGLAEVSRATVGTGSGPIPFGTSGPAEAPQGPKEPRFHFKTRCFWAQGITTGAMLRF